MSRKPYQERTEARELLMQMLFQMEVQQNFSEKAKDAYMNTYVDKSSDKKYFERLYSNVVANKDAIDEKIKEFSKNWSFNRISKVDLSIMRLAIAEILYEEKLPASVSINEAVELAKRFGGKNSGKFINGILGEVARSINIENAEK